MTPGPMATVTVLIPTFNRAKFIGEALASVFAQTYEDYQVVVVDDGSTDETETVLQPWLSKIRYFKKDNGGPSSARNFGIRHSGTAYIAFLDSDDRWEPTFLDVAMQLIRQNPALGLVTAAHVVEPEGVKRPKIPESRLEGNLYPRLFQNNFVTTSAVVVQRECFDTVGLFNEELRQAGDYDMWLRIAQAYPIAFVKEYLCRYGSHSHNISNNVVQHKLFLQQVLKANYDPNRISEKEWRVRYSRAWVSLGRAYVDLAQKGSAHKCFHEAIRLTPWRFRPWRYFLQTSL